MLPDVIMSYDITQMVNPQCIAAVNPLNLGYLGFYQGDTFSIDIDIIAVTIANAANNGILDVSLLDYVTGSISQDTYGDHIITYSQRFYGRYPGHAPVFCVELGSYTKCVIQIGDTYAVPVMRHYGVGNKQKACQWSAAHPPLLSSLPPHLPSASPPLCPSLSDDPAITSHCSDFDIMVGLIFYNSEDLDDVTNALLDLMVKYWNTSFALDNAAYDAMYLISQYNETNPQRRAKAFQFCYSQTYDLNCSIILFNFYDNSSYTVSEAYYQLEDGACNDTFTLSAQKWYECSPVL
jgi:hypothetical protein